MPSDTPKTTIYLQAIITTDAVPDFSFFKQLSSNAKVQVAPSTETSPLLENVAEESNKSQNKFSERESDPNKPITERQIKLVKSILDNGKFTLPELLDTYHVSQLSNLSDADVQKILKDAKRR